MQPTDICHAKHFFKWLMCVCVGGYVHLLISGNTSVAQRFFAINDMVRFAIPICAPTPASIALTTKIAARPASVIVVLLLNLEKIARSSGENIKLTATTTVSPSAAHAVAQKRIVSASCPPMGCGWVVELMAGTLYAGSYSSAENIILHQCNVYLSDCSHLAVGMHLQRCSNVRLGMVSGL